MKTLKMELLKILTVILVFIGVIAVYFISNHEDPIDAAENLEIATLPMVTTHYEGLEFNALHGYTLEMEAQYMRDVITPVDETRELPLTIYRYGNNLAGISYELRSLNTERLIESVDLTNWTVDNDKASAVLNLSHIPDKDQEYLLIIKLTTEKHGNIYYYTRIIEQTESDIVEQLEFVQGFSESTLDDVRFRDYIGNLEIDPSRDNTNLADVDLHSSFNNLTWGNLKVERVSDPVVSVTEISGDVSSFLLKYKVRALNSYDTYQYYNVTEFFRVKIGVNVTYVYVYDRDVEQIFDATTQNISSTRINLGLDSDLSVKYKYNSTGSFVSFVKDGSLWTMDMKNNRIISIFSFEEMEESDVRAGYDQFDIEIISTDSSGNSLFLVYGYMEKGAHEGQVGVALYRFSYEDMAVTELVFVPSTKPYNILKDSVGKFAYLTEDNLLYFMIGNSIYTVTMDSNEYMQLATNLTDGNYVINDKNNILAWHEDTSIYESETIRVIDVESKRDYVIKAADDEYVKILGFIEDDLIYGVAKKSDVSVLENGETQFPMYKVVCILHGDERETDAKDEYGNKIEVYQKDNIYVSSASVTNNILNMNRLTKNEEGKFVETSEDKLVNRQAENSQLIKLDTIVTDLKNKELVLIFAYTITSSEELSRANTESFSFTAANKLELNNETINDDEYFVYAYGNLYGKYKSLIQAIEVANTNFGMVLKPDGEIAWAKITKPDLAKLTDTSALVNKQYTQISDMINDSDYEVYDLTGIETAHVLYYGAKNIPVITYIDELGYVIISAYSSYYGVVDTFAFTSLSTGEITKMSYEEGDAKIKAGGSVFLVME